MITTTFTDPQGQTWTDAVLQVIDFSYSQHTSLNVQHDVGDINNPVTNQDSNTSAAMQVAYWPNQAARDAESTPYLLGNTESRPVNTVFHFSLETTPADVTALEAACEAYLTSTVLPPMQG